MMQRPCRESVDSRIWTHIHALRRTRGINPGDAAEALRLSAQQLQECESGVSRIEASTVLAIARVLRVSPAELLLGATGDGPMHEVMRRFARLTDADQALVSALVDVLAHRGPSSPREFSAPARRSAAERRVQEPPP